MNIKREQLNTNIALTQLALVNIMVTLAANNCENSKLQRNALAVIDITMENAVKLKNGHEVLVKEGK